MTDDQAFLEVFVGDEKVERSAVPQLQPFENTTVTLNIARDYEVSQKN